MRNIFLILTVVLACIYGCYVETDSDKSEPLFTAPVEINQPNTEDSESMPTTVEIEPATNNEIVQQDNKDLTAPNYFGLHRLSKVVDRMLVKMLITPIDLVVTCLRFHASTIRSQANCGSGCGSRASPSLCSGIIPFNRYLPASINILFDQPLALSPKNL